MAHSPTHTSFIATTWLDVTGELIARENPSHSSETAALWCAASTVEAQTAVDSAAAAFPVWAATPLADRIALLTQLLDHVEAQADAFAERITAENGKPLADAHAEIVGGLADARFAVNEAGRLGMTEPVSPSGAPVRSELRLEPLGVCLLFTPWNFPLATILRKLVPALLYGNPAIVKPSELTPGPAALLFKLIADLPFPTGTVSLVLGAGREIGPVLAGHSAVRAISFTGSTAAGLSIAQLTAGRDVRLQLEMGGKNSLVVLADADLAAAVDAAITGGFSCAGQWCTGTGRVIVEQLLHDEFVDRLTARTQALRIGPVISAERLAFAQSALAAAIAAKARLRCGGETLADGYFLTPTVLDRVTETMPVFTDELFVPILPVIAARDAEDAVWLANSGPYGLSASVFSQDIAKASALARRIEAGIVHVNLHTAFREPALPVAGWRDSGRGLPECGRFARDFFTRPRAFYVRSS